MCGIAGQILLRADAVPEPETVRAMTAALVHRGPDDEGLWCGRRAVLGFRRLSIIDLDGGHQPMGTPDGAVQVAFNGEIYDHKELRRELEAAGARFRTRADTEVLVHGLRAWGTRLPERLNGMFAFAAVDEERGEALLARDRMGKKPLFYLEHAGSLWFASELKALCRVPGWSRELDLAALDVFLSQQFVPAPFTIYRAVRKLPPGHRMIVRGTRVAIEPYWAPRFEPKLELADEEAAEELRRTLRAAVARRLESEVPLGAFLSGGVDSSTVVGLMTEALDRRVATYTIGFEEKAWDEREHARRVAERFGTDHHELVVRPSVATDLDAILAQYDEPFADPSAVPTWYVAREAAREITVVLTGDGADDVLAGYGRYDVSGVERAFAALPAPLRAPLERGALAGLVGRGALAVAARPFGKLVARRIVPHLRSLVIPAYLSGLDKRRLYRPELGRELGDDGLHRVLRELHARTRNLPEPIDRMLATDLEQYLPGDLLVKVDVATMAHSLEARSPFMDKEVVELALRLPDRLRYRDGQGKWILKRAFADLLPEGIATRPKQGFGVPIDRWLRGELAPLARERLVDGARGCAELFEPRAVERLLAEHVEGRRNNASRLWALLAFELWYQGPSGPHASGDAPSGDASARAPAGERASERRNAARSVAQRSRE